MTLWRRWWAAFARRLAHLLDAGAELAYRQAEALDDPAARPAAEDSGGPPEHWLALAHPPPPEHWLARVRAEAPQLLEPGGEGLIEAADSAEAPAVPQPRGEAPVPTIHTRPARPLLPPIWRGERRSPPEAAVVTTGSPEVGETPAIPTQPPTAGDPPRVWPSAPPPAEAPVVRRNQGESPPEIAAPPARQAPDAPTADAPRTDLAPAAARTVRPQAAGTPTAHLLETRAPDQTARPPEVVSAASEPERPPPVETRQTERLPIPDPVIRTTAPPHPGINEAGRSEAAPPWAETVLTSGPEVPFAATPPVSRPVAAAPYFPVMPGQPDAPSETAWPPRDLWPPLPERLDEQMTDRQRAFREQERRQRLDREQKGKW